MEFELPMIEALPPYPRNNVLSQMDAFHMHCAISGAWVALFDKHSGTKLPVNMTPEEQKQAAQGEPVYYEDPDYLIFVNRKTGQRFKLTFNNTTGD